MLIENMIKFFASMVLKKNNNNTYTIIKYLMITTRAKICMHYTFLTIKFDHLCQKITSY